MSSAQPAVSDLLLTAKSRELQRGMLAEMSGQSGDATPHFLAAGHLELVLADDYFRAGEPELARRSRISAASCLWKAGRQDQARQILDGLLQSDPSRAAEIQEVMTDLDGRDAP